MTSLEHSQTARRRHPWTPTSPVPGDPWSRADTMSELVSLHREYIDGHREDHPVPALVNRRALRSLPQPAGILEVRGALVVDVADGRARGAGAGAGAGAERRSFVSAVCSESDAESLVAHASKAGLLAGMWSPQVAVCETVPVERSGPGTGRAVGPASARLLSELADRLGDGAGDDLMDRGFRVLLVDPQWGRPIDHLVQVVENWSVATPHATGVAPAALSVDVAMLRLQRKAASAIDSWIGACLCRLFEAGQDAAAGPAVPRLVVLPAALDRDVDDMVEVRYHLTDGAILTFGPRHDRFPAVFALWAHVRWALASATGAPVPPSVVVDLGTSVVVAWWPEYCTEHEGPGPQLGYVVGRWQQWRPGTPMPTAVAETLTFMREQGIDAPTRPGACG